MKQPPSPIRIPPARFATGTHRWVDDPGGFLDLASPDVRSVGCPRRVRHDARTLRRWAAAWQEPLRGSGTVTEWLRELPAALKGTVPQGPVSERIVADLREVANFWPREWPHRSFRFFFGPVRDGMCRRFHTDINEARLLYTLTGPGTEFLDRDPPPGQDVAEWAEAHPQRIRKAPAGSLLLLKGALWPSDTRSAQQAHAAAWHRSPPQDGPDAFRLLFRMEPVSVLEAL